MIKAAVISIGNELLSGAGVDTNSAYIAEHLLSLGIPTNSVSIVGDDCNSIVNALGRAVEDAQVIITTGGLGPTDDDITRSAISNFTNRQLKLDGELLKDIEKFFAKRGRKVTQRNRAQAYIPQGAKGLKNETGTAPGIFVENKEYMLFALPGVPVEMKKMFEQSVIPRLESLEGRKPVSLRKLKCFGIAESDVAELLGERMQRGREPLVNTTVRDGVITVHILAQANTQQLAETTAQKEQEEIVDVLGDVVFAGGDKTLAEVVAAGLVETKKTLAVAESCTGGLIAKLLTDVPGSSNYFLCGWITYSNEAKISELDIPPEVIKEKGAVSEEVAAAMAAGARSRAGADYGLGVTGIAGPGGATADKPAGLVYISLAGAGGDKVKKHIFPGNRDSVRKRAANAALDLLRRNM